MWEGKNMFCQKCGQTLSDDAKFCENCGALTTKPPQSPPPQQTYQQPVQPAYQQTAAPQQPYAYQAPIQQPYPQGYQQPVGGYQQPYGYGAPIKKKSKAGLVIGIILGLIVVIVGIVVVAGLFGKDVSSIKMSATVDEDTYAPISPTSVFYDDTPTIHCTLVSKLPVGSLVTTEWAYEDTAYDPTSIDYYTQVKPEQIDFSIDMPDGGWPLGQYTVTVTADGKVISTVKFEVKSSGNVIVTPTGGAATDGSITDIQTAAKIDEVQATPIDPQSTFATDTEYIYATFTLNNIPVGSLLEIEWVYTTTNYVIDSLDYTTVETTEYLWTNFGRPDGGWPVGDYTVDFYIDGTYIDSAYFTVQ
jgi:hypothetical protein